MSRGGILFGVLTSTAAVRFAVWSNAMLSGRCDPDTAARNIVGGDVGHHVAGLPGHPEPATMPVALNLLRSAGGVATHLALPVPGNPVGLAGPPAFNEAALDASEAVVIAGASLEPGASSDSFDLEAAFASSPAGTSAAPGSRPTVGLVPRQVGPAVQWQVYPANVPSSVDLGEADRALRAALIKAAETLATLDLARWKPEVADDLIDIRRIGSDPSDTLAPGYDPRAVRTAATARRCLAIADAALADDGAALTITEADARRGAISALAAAARQALVAACAPPHSS